MSNKEQRFHVGQRVKLKSTMHLFDGTIEKDTVGILRLWDEQRNVWKVDFPHKYGVYVTENNMIPAGGS